MRRWITAALCAFAIASAEAQIVNTPTPGTVIQTSPHRMGLNMGGTDFFGSGEFLKNMACVMNCGAEPVLAQTIFTITSTGTTTTFVGTNAYDMGNAQTGGGQDGFNLWAGATVTVIESQSSESGSGNKGFTSTIASNQGSIQATTCSFTGTGPYTITCNTDHNPVTAGFAVAQLINWEGATGTGYTAGYQCCTITAVTTSSVSWSQAAVPTGTATGGYLGTNVAKVYTTSTAAPYAFAVGDTVVIKLLQSPTPTSVLMASTTPGLGIFGDNLFSQNSGGGTIFAATAGGGYTLCATCGSQSIGATVTNSGDAAGYGVLMDDSSGAAENFTYLSGTYQASVWAMAVSGSSPKVTVTVARSGGTTCLFSFTPTATQAQYTNNCTFAETTSQTPSNLSMTVQNVYNGGAATVLLDNLSFVKTSGLDTTNTSAYSDGFVQEMRDHCATTVSGARCTVRNWTSQNQETAASWTGGYFSAPQAGLSPAQGKSSLRLFDYLNFVAMLGNADPYIELPVTMTPADAATIVEFIDGSSSTTGGAIRAALGQSAPYTFTNVYLTYCNECWNGAAAYQNLPGRSGVPNCSIPTSNPEIYYDLSLASRDVYAAIRADSAYNPSVVQLGLPVQTANVSSLACAVARSKPDFIELNNYKQLSVADAATTAALFGADYAEPWVNANNAASASGFNRAVTTIQGLSTCGSSGTATCYPTVYETNNSTQGSCYGSGGNACSGSGTTPPVLITQGEEDSITAGKGSAIPEPLSFLLNCSIFGLCVENEFAAVEFTNSGPLGNNTAKIWGCVVDNGGQMSAYNSVKYSPRPCELGVQVMNRAIFGNMISCPVTNQPTYNWPGDPYNGFPNGTYSSSGGTPAQANTPNLYAFCFANGNTIGIVYVNTSLTATNYTVTYSGSYAPAGTVSIAQWDATNPATLCEASTGSNTAQATACSLSTSSSSGLSSLNVVPGITSIVYTASPNAPWTIFGPITIIGSSGMKIQ